MASEYSKIAGLGRVGYLWRGMTLDESFYLRAFAIVMIMAHNFMHWLPVSPGENEFGFQVDRVRLFMDGVWQHPLDSLRLVASYLGHYGVQVFFFLSAYGLTKKYSSSMPSWWVFQTKRWKAFYPAIIISGLGYFVYEGLRTDWGGVWRDDSVNLLRQMVGLSNFIPDNVYRPIGPWWFIGVILQFYLILPFVWKLLQKYGDKVLYVLLVAAWALQSVLGHVLYSEFELNINHSILGHLGVCAMGIWFARHDDIVIPWWLIVLSTALFIGGNFFYVLWIPSRVALLMFLLPLLRGLTHFIRKVDACDRLMLLLGQLSVYLFLCNGYLRRPIVEWAKHESYWWTSIWTCLVFILIVTVWALILRMAERRIFLVLGRLRA
ncbi:MAG: acyltransferase [Akkermansiaceae bacterium]|nr:acyltransferase [Akkermansiaceae bacterium]